MTSPKPLDSAVLKRLTFIRLLHQQGVDQSRLPEPLSFTSILSFHDAVEHFLVLAGEHLDASLPKGIQFLKYWDELGKATQVRPVSLSGRTAMDRLNRTRVNFKHVGAMPSRDAVEQARADVATFFEDNTPKIFGITYAKIDMTDLISQTRARNLVKDAVAAEEAGERVKAMGLLKIVFNRLFSEHLGPGGQVARSPYSFGRDFSRLMSKRDIQAVLTQPEGHTHQPRTGAQPIRQYRKATGWDVEALAKQIADVTETTVTMQQVMRIHAIGLEYHRYQRFHQLVPEIAYEEGDGEFTFQHSADYAPNDEEFGYCCGFVVAVALRLAEVEAHAVAPSWRQGSSADN